MLRLNLKPETEKMFKKILYNYQGNHETFVKNIFEYQVSELKKEILNIQLDLRAFEKKYKLSTEEFYKKFNNAELGDDTDYMIWAGIYEMFKRSEKKLEDLSRD